ncbi:2-phosphosulfolactate phosphatase [Cytobacillus firmus]|uniref:Probable 2-phosphosulfolactate phosphatase n=2 Tax=Cytobacillus TaxID=2675230 RepID=A0A366K5L9_CYTFI|nr:MULTISPECIES: 2-phosphosulfolactate phosphatase [Cytobacillus]RBP96582.1 2-phosphosulfolactate phosphatase [Cytobacillus firmus]TDX45691.1 2-phosphosulfolactate phosphatase [Cytobacillus oceanisediminis]
MKKVHVIVRKEDISEEKLSEGSKVAVVLDILLATTTITSALSEGAAEVIPVLDVAEGMNAAAGMEPETFVLAGETHGKLIDGFVYPIPSRLREMVNGKKLILSTTNGTVALRKSACASKVYISSLLNNRAVAESIKGEAETVIVVCSGNSGELSLEDFYGAGHFIDCLTDYEQWEMTDSAKAALDFYRGASGSAFDILSSSRVGMLFARHGMAEELEFASQTDMAVIVPILKNGRAAILQTALKGE